MYYTYMIFLYFFPIMKPAQQSPIKQLVDKISKMAEDRNEVRIGIIALIVVIVGGIGFGAYSLLSANRDENTLRSSAELRGTETNTTYSEGSKKAVDLEERTEDASTNPSEGLKESISIGTADTGIDIGDSIYKKHIENLRVMRNYTFINVVDLTSESPDRAKVLAEYDSTLRSYLQKSKDSLYELETEIALLQSDQKHYQDLANAEEKAFRDYLKNYDGVEADASLEAFIEAQKQAGELYTRAKAMQLLASVYTPLTRLIDTKIKFIAANKEALLKGVSVVDIRGLEETLIRTEKEWLQSIE